ncbi:hypothetical protein SDC9_183197 [bioreactor metagenome]|uniref:Uncharacterized protein n=1 Tax=bioreactor metagenome TaxID=1076179 RepID=A0A645HC55_9ZZZZ
MIEWDLRQNRDMMLRTKHFRGIFSFNAFVKHRAIPLAEHLYELVNHAEIVYAEDGGLCDQNAVIGVFNALHDSA